MDKVKADKDFQFGFLNLLGRLDRVSEQLPESADCYKLRKFFSILFQDASLQINHHVQFALLSILPYRSYLSTEHWKEKRAGAIARAGGKCVICNSEEKLNVHHRTYERLGREADGDLIVLCGDCHTLFHANGKLADAPDDTEPVNLQDILKPTPLPPNRLPPIRLMAPIRQ